MNSRRLGLHIHLVTMMTSSCDQQEHRPHNWGRERKSGCPRKVTQNIQHIIQHGDCWDVRSYRNGLVHLSIYHPLRLSVCPSRFCGFSTFQTNNSGNWSQTWWIHLLWYFPDLINLVCRTTTISWPLIGGAVWNLCAFLDKLLRGSISNFVDTLIMILPRPDGLWSRFAEFPLFPGLGLVEQLETRFDDRIKPKFCGQTRGSLQAWLTFVHAPLNSHCFLASDWPSSCRQTADGIELKVYSLEA